MPILRVIRDKRGYETTYLIHRYREGARQRSRILYVFRTLGGVRVGRKPLDPEILRDIEAHHPGITFEWKAVMAARQVVETSPGPGRPRRPRRAVADRPAVSDASSLAVLGVEPAEPSVPNPAPLPPIPSTLEGSTPSAQIEFLAVWHPIVCDRIPQRTSDPARREALLALAERLNPAAWTDADEIAAGLQAAAESLDRLSRVLSRRRRKPRRTPARSVISGSTVSGAEPSESSEASASVEPALAVTVISSAILPESE